ncbi:hypothetical protein PPROV_000096800 [Pycnococcus provasolii]|uniref:Methyltransferase type 11 domain-containing protein n=1 Tax=Pycnococcus provasolii TaxID=41880 RepID=A0A830H9B7_9CHLO|nr:hypothetical protein PPROV_000096800 [Pycnococcus provasolii]
MAARCVAARCVRPSAAASLANLPRRSALFAAAMGLGASRSPSPRALAAAAQAAEDDPVASILLDPKFPESWPYGADAFARYDEAPDGSFYTEPRFVTHIDDRAIEALSDYYAASFPPVAEKPALLDLCSSWISHYPKDYNPSNLDSVVGLGMNEDELQRNGALTSFVVKDLNEDPVLPFDDNSFDVVTNAVSVDYLTRPLEVFREMHRVLKPGGTAIMSFSNRCFPTKAIAVWTQTGDPDHIWIVGSYFHYAGGFEKPQAKEITKRAGMLQRGGDPMYVVFARKQLS